MRYSDDKNSASDALDWMKHLCSRGERLLFRGQSRVYDEIRPSLFRQSLCEGDRDVWWSVTKRFVNVRHGVTGFAIKSPHDAIAVVQHYLLKSPVVDVTMTPEVAIYFSLLGPSADEKRVVYAIEAKDVFDAGYHVTDHSFLALPPSDGGLEARWLRQDGFTIGATVWDDLDSARSLDLLKLKGLDSFEFKSQSEDGELFSGLGNLEKTEGDPLAQSVRSVFEISAISLRCLEVVQRLMPLKGTVDGRAKLVEQISELLDGVRQLGFSEDDIVKIERLKDMAGGEGWDTSWDAEFEYWKARVTKS
jgi:hypothetical protein